MRINNREKFIILCLALILIFGSAAFWLNDKNEKEKARQPEEQVKAFLRSIQKTAPDFFTDEIKNIETPEIQKLQEKNPLISETFAQKRVQDINDLKQKIKDSVERNWLGFAKTGGDREKIKQVNFLEQIAAQAYKKGEETEKFFSLLSQLKDSGHFRTRYSADQAASVEILPSLIYADEKITAAETPYDISLPQKDAPELKFNQKDKAGETRLALTLKNSNRDNLKVYDNRALYSEIRKGIDQLLITQADGLNIFFIIKNPLSLQVKEEKGILILEYDLDANQLIATEDQGALIFTDKNNLKQYVLTPPVLADINKQTPGEARFDLTQNEAGASQLRVEIKINKEAGFPLLVNFNLLPALTRYVDKTDKAVEAGFSRL